MWNLEVSRVVFCVRKLSCTLIACYFEYTSITIGECIDYNICSKRASFLLSYILLEIWEGCVCVCEREGGSFYLLPIYWPKVLKHPFAVFRDPRDHMENIHFVNQSEHLIIWKIYTVSTNQNRARRFHRVSKWPRLHCLYIYSGFCKNGTLHENITKCMYQRFHDHIFAFDFNFSLSVHLYEYSDRRLCRKCSKSVSRLVRKSAPDLRHVLSCVECAINLCLIFNPPGGVLCSLGSHETNSTMKPLLWHLWSLCHPRQITVL